MALFGSGHYQKDALETSPGDYSDAESNNVNHNSEETDNEENKPLLSVEYGSIDAAATTTGGSVVVDRDQFQGNDEEAVFKRRRSSSWVSFGLAVVLFVAFIGASLLLSSQDISSSLDDASFSNEQSLEMVVAPLLAKAKKDDKATKKAEKKKAKEAKKQAKAERKANKKNLKDEKKEDKETEKKSDIFEPSGYPGCPMVNVTYIQTPKPWAAHEAAAAAAGCHLASIHDLVENTKLSSGGLFKMTPGPEIGMSFATGKLLSKEFYLGGFVNETLDWEWLDGSEWDFGPNTTEGAPSGACLQSSVNFTEIILKNISFVDHWVAGNCTTPLPAMYKCCLPTEAPSMAPSDVPYDIPTAVPTEATPSPTDTPSDAPSDSPSDTPTEATTSPTETPTTEAPSVAPTDSPSDSPTDAPTETTASPTETPSVSPTPSPTDAPVTPSPTKAPTDAPVEPKPKPVKKRATPAKKKATHANDAV